MTNHRVGRSVNRDPRGGRWGKQDKTSTSRFLRYRGRRETTDERRFAHELPALGLGMRRGGL